MSDDDLQAIALGCFLALITLAFGVVLWVAAVRPAATVQPAQTFPSVEGSRP